MIGTSTHIGTAIREPGVTGEEKLPGRHAKASAERKKSGAMCAAFPCSMLFPVLFLARHAIESQQQPAAQLLLDRMMPVADSRLRHLGNQGLGVAQQKPHHRTGSIEF